MSKVLLCSVSDDRFGRKNGLYEATQQKVESIFRNNIDFGITDFYSLTWNKLVQTKFYEDNKILLDNTDAARNGRCAKPYAISEALKFIDEGEYLIYTDVSPEMWQFPGDYLIPDTYNLNILKHICAKNGGFLSAFVKWDTRHIPNGLLGIHTHANFTLDRCINKMGLWSYRDSFQHASGMIVIQKQPKTVQFLEEWLYWNTVPECCSMGDPSIPGDYSYWDAEDYKKMGSRSDQSISGLLVNKYGYHLVDPPHTDLNPYNFLNFCRVDKSYKLIDPNYNPDTRERLKKGDTVLNKAGQELKIFEIWPQDGEEVYIVGAHRESAYKAYENDLKIKE